MSLVKRHPIITFFVLAYALAWIIESPLVLLRDSVTAGDPPGLFLVILASNVPSLLAIVLTAVVLGRGALRKLLGRLLIWRVNPLWYLVVFLGPVALTGGTVALNTLLGRPALSFVVIVAGPKHLSRKHRKQEEEGAAEPGVATPPGVVKPTPA